MPLKQVAELGDIQVQLQFARLTFPRASRKIAFLIEIRVSLFWQVANWRTKRFTTDQVRESRPWVDARKRIGNIAIAGTDAASNAMTEAAIEEAHRSVHSLVAEDAYVP